MASVSTVKYYGASRTHYYDPQPIPGLVTISGGAGTGKTTVARNLVDILVTLGFPAITISTGFIYRLLAFLALEAAARSRRAPTSFTDAELVAFARSRQVMLVGGQVWVDDASVPEASLRSAAVDEIVTHWGNDPAATTFARELIRAQIAAFNGIVIIDGRSANTDYADVAGHGTFWLAVNPETAARRTGKPVAAIIARDEADMASGALPRQPVGRLVRTDDLNLDLATTPILRWMIEGGIPGLGLHLVGVEPVAR